MLYHMNNTFRNTVFQISVDVPLRLDCFIQMRLFHTEIKLNYVNQIKSWLSSLLSRKLLFNRTSRTKNAKSGQIRRSRESQMEYLIHNYCPVFKWWTFFTFIINCQKQEGVILLFFSFFHLSFYLLFYPCKFDDSTAKGRISKQEIKSRQIFRKTNISYRLMRSRTCAYQGVRNVRFSENLTCFVFLLHPF